MDGYSKLATKLFFVLCFAMTMLFFSIMFSLKYMADETGVIGCADRPSNAMIYDYGKAINSKSMAKKIVESHLAGIGVEPNLKELGSTIENCGPAFMFLDRGLLQKFYVCENGKLYEYVKVCD